MRPTLAVVLCALLLCCCALPSEATRAECPDPNNPQHCLDEGEECLSGRVSQCKPGFECPVEINVRSFCKRTIEIYPQCKDPPVHCKREGDSCAPAPISQCMSGLYCDTYRGKCVRGTAPGFAAPAATAPPPSYRCEHCKPLGAACNLATISECVSGLCCDKDRRVCVWRSHRKLH